jgi:hypothetical protein
MVLYDPRFFTEAGKGTGRAVSWLRIFADWQGPVDVRIDAYTTADRRIDKFGKCT